ncbi:kinase-like domain-containing protein [Lophiotrema nucula]|uniref:Kinase-like domain-containing protein n=1 Tax=Lophiotrema nucula TaxID=690887 RepID=A0A6A5ZMX2_9PLEO|nr:kinase-like domain-containing protein [Lophiotrema nucula]
MSSMFRRPGEDSSSDSSSSGKDEDESTNLVSDEGLGLLSRINTLDSTGSGRLPAPATRPAMSRNNSQLRDLILHSLLEDKALTEAAKTLGKDRNDPEVQELARTSYQALTQQLSGSGSGPDADVRYASDEMRQARALTQKGIDEAIARTQLPQIGPQRPGALISVSSSSRLNVLVPNIPPPISLPLQGYPGLHTDRYVREFVEIDTIGKGGYGRVYKVKHRLDDSFYAIKRIMVSPARLQKIQEHGPKEMESMLEEVRALARFDHGNVVRYHNCWLEFTSAPVEVPPPSFVINNRLIENVQPHSFSASDVHGLQSGMRDLSFGDPFLNSDHNKGAGIIFEDTDPFGVSRNESEDESHGVPNSEMPTPKGRPRRASGATIATISSTRSHRSAIASVDEEDDEEIEMIPRGQVQYSEDGTSDLSQSMVSHSDVPAQLVTTRTTGPVLTLNVQMSLYDTNLAAFLSSDPASHDSSGHLCHCFHPCISLELLSQILSGVEYLHAQGIVHRDLKPANIFLSLSTSKVPPFGSVDLSSCRHCPNREGLHITPRIGDFGLVAALGDGAMTSDTSAKPVGTEFYRPEVVERTSEKLDVFALGVLGFEMLQQFGTRMERVDALTRLRKGEFPEEFVGALGERGDDVCELIKGMVKADEEKRSDCEKVQQSIKDIVQRLRA